MAKEIQLILIICNTVRTFVKLIHAMYIYSSRNILLEFRVLSYYRTCSSKLKIFTNY